VKRGFEMEALKRCSSAVLSELIKRVQEPSRFGLKFGRLMCASAQAISLCWGFLKTPSLETLLERPKTIV
ncbi:hypothetical protein, partial [Enterococcus faecium]|uniref:hypothetical protein n=1 Tax=Enterococcus faecium TaxID=1352 RepID=UPI001D13EBA5